MKSKSTCVVMAVAALVAGVVHAETLTYGSADDPIDSQSVALTAQTAVDGITAYLKPLATLTLTGGPLVFADSAQVKVVGGRLVIDAPSTLKGAVNVKSIGAEPTYGTDPDTSISADKTNPTTVFAGWPLSALIPAAGQASGTSDKSTKTVYNIRRGDGWMEAQFQSCGGTTSALKCYKVRFEQSGADVVAYVVYARYNLYDAKDPSRNALGYDFDADDFSATYTPGQGHLWQVTMTQDLSDYGVGFRQPVSGSSAALQAVASGLNAVTLEGSAVTNEDGTISVKLVAGTQSRARLRDIPDVTLTGPIAGSYGTLEVERTADGNESAVLEDTVEVNITDYAAVNAYLNWTLVQEGALLRDLTNVVGKIAGKGIGSAFEPPTNGSMGTFFFRNNGGSATAQVQWRPKTTEGLLDTCKCVVLEFRQGDRGVEMRIAKSAYMQNTPYAKTGLDFFALPYNYVWGGLETKAGTTGYTCPYVKMMFRTGRYAMYRNTYGATISKTDSGKNTHSMVRGGYVVKGTENHPILLSVATQYTGPSSGAVSAEGYGIFQTSTNGQTAGALSYGLSVRPDGMLFATDNTLGNHKAFSVDGGIVMMGPERKESASSTYLDITGYLQDIALSNGAVVAGWGFRCGYNFDQVTFAVGGTSPSLIDTPITFCSKDKYVMNDIVFDVADTTGDGLKTADLTVNGKIQIYSPGYFDFSQLVKTGAGTLLLNGAYAPTNDVIVTEGAVQLGKNDLFGAKTKLRLNGGTFAGAANTTNTVGELKIAASSSVALGADASLCLPAPTEWADGAGLSVTQPEGSVFRIGTSACLTPAQVRRVRVNGRHVAQNDDGSFSPLGAVLIVR